MSWFGILILVLISLVSSSCYAMTCQGIINGVFYDLSPLAGVDTSVIPSIGGYNYYIHVCGAVQASGCMKNGSAMVCQVRKSPLNQFESVLAYSDDQHPPSPTWSPSTINVAAGVALTFTNGDKCNLHDRTTIIDFYCDSTGKDQITIIESPACQFNIAYPTKVVCPAPPPPPPSCAQMVYNKWFDLTPLTGWDYHITDTSVDFYVSVCGVVETSPCGGHNAIACVTSTPPETYKSGLAYPTQQPVWAPYAVPNGGVTMTYTNGDICPNFNGTHSRLILQFQCDPSATNVTVSVDWGYCTYSFLFKTNAACPQPPPPMTCSQTVDGVLYDLTPLQGKDISIIPASGLYNYYIDVCGSAQACIQQGSAFACQVAKQPVDQFVAILAYSDIGHIPPPEWTTSNSVHGGVTLTFTNGDQCNAHIRKTIIDFQCDRDGTGIFYVVESPACVFHIIYPTIHVCVNQPVPAAYSSPF